MIRLLIKTQESILGPKLSFLFHVPVCKHDLNMWGRSAVQACTQTFICLISSHSFWSRNQDEKTKPVSYHRRPPGGAQSHLSRLPFSSLGGSAPMKLPRPSAAVIPLKASKVNQPEGGTGLFHNLFQENAPLRPSDCCDPSPQNS